LNNYFKRKSIDKYYLCPNLKITKSTLLLIKKYVKIIYLMRIHCNTM